MISFDQSPSGGVRVTDELDRRTFHVRSDDIFEPTPCETDDFPFPIDRAITVTTDSLRFDSDYGAYIRDGDGEFLTQVFEETRFLPRENYYIDISTMSKTYIRVRDTEISATVPDNSSDDPVVFKFDRPIDIDIGVRSAHSRPAGTITTTDDPRDMMRAVSYLGSSLKEYSCERSWPTLRGHPPTIELGNTFRVPRDLEKPDTGITIEVPPTYESVYSVAPLAFYMGAEVVPGDTARLVTETGTSQPLGEEANIGAEAFLTLKHCHLLDCIVRNGGYYEYDSYEGNRLADDLPFNPESLRDAPIPEQVDAYLSVSREVVNEHLPRGGTEVIVRHDPGDVELLSFLAAELVYVHVEAEKSETPDGVADGSGHGLFHKFRSRLKSGSDTPDSNPETVERASARELTVTRSIATDSTPPMGYNQVIPEAFMNRIGRKPLKKSTFSAVVVCTEDEMWEEVRCASREYTESVSDDRQIALEIVRNPTTDELASLLMDEHQFLHYIGHIDKDGFVCSDGSLDARTRPYVGVEGFLLNACNSHKEGVELIRKGSVGGIVTLTDVVTERAVKMGARLSAMLNLGYPVGPALSLSMQADPLFGGQYRVVGDSNAELRRMEGGEFVFSLNIRSEGPDKHVCEIKSYESSSAGVGGIVRPYSDVTTDESFITGTTMETRPLSTDELVEYLQNVRGATFLPDGSFIWAEDATASDVTTAYEKSRSQ